MKQNILTIGQRQQIEVKFKSMIEVSITIHMKTKTFKMEVSEWLKLRDAQFGVAPLDEKVYELLSQYT